MKVKFALKATTNDFILETEDGTEIEDLETLTFVKEKEKYIFQWHSLKKR